MNVATHSNLFETSKISPADLPTPPAVALQIVRACADQDISSQQLAEIISSDTALLTELLRMVNSPYFGAQQEVNTALRAVVIMGNGAIRNFALCFSARETLRTFSNTNLDTQGYWEEVLRRAVAARILAQNLGVDADEAFTIGMLQDIGLLALLIAYPEHQDKLAELKSCIPGERYRLEQDIFECTHDKAARALTELWDMPDSLAIPISQHHNEFFSDISFEAQNMCNIAACADWMAAVYTATDTRLALAHCRKILAERFGIDQNKTDEMLMMMAAGIEEAAMVLNIKIPHQVSYEDLLKDANQRLIESSNTEDRDHRLKEALEARDQLATELQQAYDRLAQLAYYDPLTTLVNRRRFEEVFTAEITRHSRSSKPISLVMMDLDRFKDINDKHGHPFGDTVLQAVADALKKTIRSSDLAVRYGGEEMCLLLPETNASGGKIAAERALTAVRELHFQMESKKTVNITASFGGSTWFGNIMDNKLVTDVMKSIISTADEALYLSKNKGRNQTSWAASPA